MKPEIVFCNLASEKYRLELIALRSLILAPITLWQTTKSKIEALQYITYVAIQSSVDLLEKQLQEILLIDALYHSTSGRRLCLLIFASKHLLDCLMNIPIFGLSTLSPSIQAAIKSDFETCEQYICNLKFKKILDAYGNKAVQDIVNALNDLKNRLINEFQIETLLNAYKALLTSTEITLAGCNSNTYNILEFFLYLNELSQEANQLCEEAGIVVDNRELTVEAKKLSIEIQADNTWDFALDSSFVALQTNIDNLKLKIDDLISRAGNGPGSEPNKIPKDKLMR